MPSQTYGPGPEAHLWETPDTGPLDTRGVPLKELDAGGPSLSGPEPNLKGLGGSWARQPSASDLGAKAPQPPRPIQKPVQQAPRPMSPEELMAWADATEQDFIQRTDAARQPGQSAVQPALEHDTYGYVDDGTGTPKAQFGPPEWLMQYMESQPTMGEFGPIDKVDHKKKLSEQEMLRHLKNKLK